MENSLRYQIIKAVEIGKKMFGGGEGLGRACTPPVSGANISRWSNGKVLPKVGQIENLLELVGARLVLPDEEVVSFAKLHQLSDTELVEQKLIARSSRDSIEPLIDYVIRRKHAQPRMLFHPDYLRALDVKAQDGFLYEIHNDEMLPTLRAGDQVLADKSLVTASFTPELFVIFVPAEDTIIVRRLSCIDGILRIAQDSGNRIIELPPERQASISILGKVIWAGRRIA